MKKSFLYGLVLSLVAGSLLVAGCHKTLEAGGAYSPSTTNAATGAVTTSPDIAFFTLDSAFWAAYSTIDTVFSIERDNRELLWKVSPAIKHTLDSLRPTAVEVKNGYLKARANYIANPTPAGLTGIQAILAKLQELGAAVTAALPADLSITGSTTNAPAK